MYKKLYLVGGFPGSGKTEFADSFAQRKGIMLLDKDVITRHLVEELCTTLSGNCDDRESDTYSSKVRPLEYETLMDIAWLNLKNNQNVVCDAPFIKEFRDQNWLDKLKTKCAKEDVILKLLWVQSTPEIMRERLIARSAGRDKWKIDNWQTYQRGVNLYSIPEVDWVIDNSSTTLSLLALEVDRLVGLSESFDEVKLQYKKFASDSGIVEAKIGPENVFLPSGETFISPHSALTSVKTPEEANLEQYANRLIQEEGE